MSWLDKLALGIGVGAWEIFIVAIISLAIAIPVSLLWDLLMPIMFGIKRAIFWEVWGASSLAVIIYQGYLIKNTNSS